MSLCCKPGAQYNSYAMTSDNLFFAGSESGMITIPEEKIIEKGYNSVFGMRSIKHFAQSSIEDIVSKNIISETWKPGSSAEIKMSDLDEEISS